ncbi:hypothetical protein B0H11DRAFT_2063608 [Mycena galericulata]|nr:hypothetical protein B0H11DRAFT_2063608 [Mycena galericulata]
MPMSAKARGKQRENDSPQRMLVGSEPRTPSANPSRTPSPALDGGAIWMQSRRSTSRGRSISGRSQVTRSPVMSDYFVGLDPSPARGTLQTTPPGAHYYSTAPPTRQLPSPTALDEQAALPILDTLPSSLDNQQQYGNGTVDPSLLFGGLMEPEVPISLEHEEDARMRSPSPFSSSSSCASASSSARSAHPPPLRTSGRQPVQRHVPVYMISTDLLHSDDESKSSSSASYASDRPKPTARPKPHPKPKQISTKGPAVKSGETKVNASVPSSVPNADRFFRYSGPPWPPGDNDEVCHQCRSRKRYLTMSFDECSHNYCVRCVMLRYEPDTVPFECFASTQDCPACSETCTCDKCTIRRGQNYASARSKRHSSRTPELRLHTSRVSVASPSSPKLRYPSLEQKVIEPAAYYATMYDLTGAPIARTYTGADGDEGVIVAKRLPKRRVFIGVVQEEWGLGTNPQVFMEPVPVLAKKPPTPGHERYYIGRQSVLSLRVRRRPPRPVVAAATPVLPTVPLLPAPAAEPDLNVFPMDLDSDSFGSPLSSLDDTDTTGEDVGEGESAHRLTSVDADGGGVQKLTGIHRAGCPDAGPPDVLTDSDVAKAISCAFNELGISTVMAIDL